MPNAFLRILGTVYGVVEHVADKLAVAGKYVTCRAESSEKSESGKSVSENDVLGVSTVTCQLDPSCDSVDAGGLWCAPLLCEVAVAL